MKRVLLVEDDQKLSLQIARTLKGVGLSVNVILTLDELEASINGQEKIDLIVLDRLIGNFDTKEKMGEIKQRWNEVPILIVSAVNTPTERAELINLGADDYIGKPFLSEELIARIRSLLRRTPEKKSADRRIGKAIIDLTHRRITVGEKFENLPAKEFMILNALSETPGKVISRSEILTIVWGNINHSETNLVEATVTNLRRRLANIDCGFEIKNQRSAGYWIES